MSGKQIWFPSEETDATSLPAFLGLDPLSQRSDQKYQEHDCTRANVSGSDRALCGRAQRNSGGQAASASVGNLRLKADTFEGPVVVESEHSDVVSRKCRLTNKDRS